MSRTSKHVPFLSTHAYSKNNNMHAVSLRLKGEAGEELFATFFVIVLVFVFLFSAIGVYANFIGGQTQLYAERSASSLAEKVFFDNSGLLSKADCDGIGVKYGSMNNTAVRVTYWVGGVKTFCETRLLDARSLSVASMPILVTENGKYYPGRIDAMVGV